MSQQRPATFFLPDDFTPATEGEVRRAKAWRKFTDTYIVGVLVTDDPIPSPTVLGGVVAGGAVVGAIAAAVVIAKVVSRG